MASFSCHSTKSRLKGARAFRSSSIDHPVVCCGFLFAYCAKRKSCVYVFEMERRGKVNKCAVAAKVNRRLQCWRCSASSGASQWLVESSRKNAPVVLGRNSAHLSIKRREQAKLFSLSFSSKSLLLFLLFIRIIFFHSTWSCWSKNGGGRVEVKKQKEVENSNQFFSPCFVCYKPFWNRFSPNRLVRVKFISTMAKVEVD